MKEDHQPAFPTWKRSEDMAEGMTLRDYFAAAALTGLLASAQECGADVGEYAYMAADEMLKARQA